MKYLIDKDAVVAEIERTLDDCGGRSVMAWSDGFKNFLNTLEAKEVDLEEEIKLNYNPIDGLEFEEYKRIAMYYFELGLKAQKGE